MVNYLNHSPDPRGEKDKREMASRVDLQDPALPGMDESSLGESQPPVFTNPCESSNSSSAIVSLLPSLARGSSRTQGSCGSKTDSRGGFLLRGLRCIFFKCASFSSQVRVQVAVPSLGFPRFSGLWPAVPLCSAALLGSGSSVTRGGSGDGGGRISLGRLL